MVTGVQTVLFISEATYQATQGKNDRTAGILNALKYAEIPPELEINKTPRSSQLGITNKVCIHFNRGNDISPGVGWVSTNSPRSSMEPGINEWLENMIGDPRRIVCEIAEQENDTLKNKRKIKLSELKLNAIDLVYIVGEDMNSAAKELDMLFEGVYRSKVDVGNGNFVSIIYEPEQINSNERPVIALLPLLRSLRLMLGSSRAAHAKDYLPRTKGVEQNSDALHRWRAGELKRRVALRKKSMTDIIVDILSKPLNGQATTSENPKHIKQMMAVYDQRGQSTEYLQKIEITKAATSSIMKFLKKAYLFGVKINIPFAVDHENPTQRKDLLVQLISTVETLKRKNAEAKQCISKSNEAGTLKMKIEGLIDAGKKVLGEDFLILPQFTFANQADLKSSFTKDTDNDLLKFKREQSKSDDDFVLEEWFDSVGAVRSHVRLLNDCRLMSEAQTDHELDFIAAQMPFQEKDTWLAVEFPEIDERTDLPFEVKHDTICLAIEGKAALKVGAIQTALVLDDWKEFIPNKKEITGVTFNYNQPNASAPNTMLLAVEPTGGSRWSFETLLGTLKDTLRRAKSRAVEPNHLLDNPVLDTMSPMTVASFDLNQVNVSLDYLVANPKFLKAMQVKNFALYKDFEITNS
ncbi:MAG: hypothetical protein AAGK97_02405, partial [Bacteroidota bacterium]